MFFAFTLPNGIRCILGRTRSTVTHCGLMINVGSRDELAGEHGMAHMVEHCLFKGTAHRRAFHINSRLENLGGELNAFTTKEDTTVHATTLRADFPKAAELIADIVFASVFPEHELEREKQVIVDEINSYRDMPQEMLYDRFEELMFGGSPLGRNILGTARSVKKFNRTSLLNFISRTYTPDRMVFAAVGNMSEKTFTAVCERYFGGVGGAATAAGGSATNIAGEAGMTSAAGAMREAGDAGSAGLTAAGVRGMTSAAEVVTVGAGTGATGATNGFERVAPPPLVPFEEVAAKGANHQAHCILGNRAYSLSDARRIPLSLLINILGGPAANSRLNTVLRERNGLSYNVETIFQPFSDTGFAGAYFGCEKDKLERCRELVNAELQRVMNTPLTPRQLSMAKRQFVGQFSISMSSSESYMLGAAKSYLIYNDIDSPQVVAQKVGAITADELMEVARDVFGSLSTLIYR